MYVAIIEKAYPSAAAAINILWVTSVMAVPMPSKVWKAAFRM